MKIIHSGHGALDEKKITHINISQMLVQNVFSYLYVSENITFRSGSFFVLFSTLIYHSGLLQKIAISINLLILSKSKPINQLL